MKVNTSLVWVAFSLFFSHLDILSVLQFQMQKNQYKQKKIRRFKIQRRGQDGNKTDQNTVKCI